LQAADTVDLDIDILRAANVNAAPCYQIGPKIGFECVFSPHPAPRYRLPDFIEGLVARSLCTRAKGDALVGWPGGFNERKSQSVWPADLLARSKQLGPGTASTYLRWPYHIKLVYRQYQGITEAKAYLAMRQFWPTKSDVTRMSIAVGEAVQAIPSTNRE
jgi:hypothetical protein